MAEHDEKQKVRVTVYHTATAGEKHFNADLDWTVQQVVEEAYEKLKERRRDGDQYFSHAEPRIDLAPYFGTTLSALHAQGIGVIDQGRNRLEFEFDIDVTPGGA